MALTYTLSVVNVDDEKLWDEGHLIKRWFDGMTNELEVAIKAEAPHSNEPGGTKNYPPRPNKSRGAPGDLRRGIEALEPDRVGPRALETRVISRAEHTLYVLYGTQDIRAQARDSKGRLGAGRMILPGQPWVRRMRRGKVSGQEPNNFFGRGYDIVAARHSSLR